jgi:hypothetical protein
MTHCSCFSSSTFNGDLSRLCQPKSNRRVDMNVQIKEFERIITIRIVPTHTVYRYVTHTNSEREVYRFLQHMNCTRCRKRKLECSNARMQLDRIFSFNIRNLFIATHAHRVCLPVSMQNDQLCLQIEQRVLPWTDVLSRNRMHSYGRFTLHSLNSET